MLLGIIFLSIYFLLMLVPGFLPEGRKRNNRITAGKGSDESFFLSGKSLSTAVLLVYIAATNFSAFTILGLSGAGFMALGMYLIGTPLGEHGRKRNYIIISCRQERIKGPILYLAILFSWEDD